AGAAVAGESGRQHSREPAIARAWCSRLVDVLEQPTERSHAERRAADGGALEDRAPERRRVRAEAEVVVIGVVGEAEVQGRVAPDQVVTAAAEIRVEPEA